MTYLVIFIVVAGAGILALWIHQRRQRSHLGSVDGFRASLERISSSDIVVPAKQVTRPTSVRPKGSRLEPLDPVRREAARRRLEARRAIRAS
ncbi:MAG TPA: hypothetical protein VG408_08835 [Actinomycetota bacterium]|nr:hypothetical protein [Actinomycetota bacterium]